MGFGWFCWLLLLFLSNGYDVDMNLPLVLLLLVSLARRRGKGERQGKRRRAHDFGLCLSQETLLGSVGVLVCEERGEKRERAVAGRAAELGTGL